MKERHRLLGRTRSGPSDPVTVSQPERMDLLRAQTDIEPFEGNASRLLVIAAQRHTHIGM